MFRVEKKKFVICILVTSKLVLNSLISFNAVLIRLVAQVNISLLLNIQWREYDYLSEHRCGSVWELWSRDHDDTESGYTCRARGEDVEIGIG
jgi:hypothetical protein